MLIVCGIDRSPAAAEAAHHAVDLARKLHADVLFVHVLEGVAIPAAVPPELHAPCGRPPGSARRRAPRRGCASRASASTSGSSRRVIRPASWWASRIGAAPR
jgi:hypothetical protein